MRAKQVSQVRGARQRNALVQFAVPTPWHRLRQARLRAGKSRQEMARLTQTTTEQIEAEEDEYADISLSALQRWQQALGVPYEELLVDSHSPLMLRCLTGPRMRRLRLLASCIADAASDRATSAFARGLVEQLDELIPARANENPG